VGSKTHRGEGALREKNLVAARKIPPKEKTLHGGFTLKVKPVDFVMRVSIIKTQHNGKINVGRTSKPPKLGAVHILYLKFGKGILSKEAKKLPGGKKMWGRENPHTRRLHWELLNIS